MFYFLKFILVYGYNTQNQVYEEIVWKKAVCVAGIEA